MYNIMPQLIIANNTVIVMVLGIYSVYIKFK